MNYNKWMYILVALLWVGCQPQEPSDDVVEQPAALTDDGAAMLLDAVNIQLQVNGSVNESVVLESYRWDAYRKIAVVELDVLGQGSYRLSYPYQAGLYRISFAKGKHKPYYFMVNGRDAELSIETSAEKLHKGIASVSPVKEMDCHDLVTQMYSETAHKIDSLVVELGKVSFVTPDYYTQKNAIREQMEQVKQELTNNLVQVAASCNNTYTRQVLIDLLVKPTRYSKPEYMDEYEHEASFLHAHYFDGLDVSSEAYLGHPLLLQTINEYLQTYAGEFESDYQNAADEVLAHIRHPVVKELVTDYLIYHYIDRNALNVALYVAENHVEGCTDDYLEQLKQDATYKSGLQPGSDMPPALVTTLQGVQLNLNEQVTKAPWSLVYFWKSGCPHCEEEHSVVKRLHELYADDGLQIIGVSLDEDVAAIEATQNEFDMSWPVAYSKQPGQLIMDYSIRKTPAVYVVNRSGQIVATNIYGEGLKELFMKLYPGS